MRQKTIDKCITIVDSSKGWRFYQETDTRKMSSQSIMTINMYLLLQSKSGSQKEGNMKGEKKSYETIKIMWEFYSPTFILINSIQASLLFNTSSNVPLRVSKNIIFGII
jgi:hypothetical protein